MRLVNRVCVTLLGCGALAACGGDDDGGGDGGGDGQGTVDPAGDHYGYVLDGLVVPTTVNQASQVGLDIDGNGSTDNALGGLLAALSSSAGLDLQGSVEEQIAIGSPIILADVQATSLTSATGVGVQVFLGGNPNPAPCADESDTVCGRHLQGGASFSVAMAYDALVVGSIVNGSFSGGPGEVTIELALSDGPAVPVRLVGARIQMSVTENGLMSGKLGGAITEEDIQNDLMPAIVGIIDGLLEECTGTAPDCCPEGSTGEQVLGFFDANEDCMITQAELEENTIISSTIGNPDLDLFDGSGNFNPRQDGVKDSLSLGIGFTAKSAVFTAP
jgi:hypothetical protein